MTQKRLLLLVIITAVAVMSSAAYGDELANRTITVTGPPLTVPASFGACVLGENLTVINNFNGVIEVAYNNTTTYQRILQGQNAVFPCTDACDYVVVRAFEKDAMGYKTSSENGACSPTNVIAAPSLSTWALVVFSILLLGSAAYYIVRRRQQLA